MNRNKLRAIVMSHSDTHSQHITASSLYIHIYITLSSLYIYILLYQVVTWNQIKWNQKHRPIPTYIIVILVSLYILTGVITRIAHYMYTLHNISHKIYKRSNLQGMQRPVETGRF